MYAGGIRFLFTDCTVQYKSTSGLALNRGRMGCLSHHSSPGEGTLAAPALLLTRAAAVLATAATSHPPPDEGCWITTAAALSGGCTCAAPPALATVAVVVAIVTVAVTTGVAAAVPVVAAVAAVVAGTVDVAAAPNGDCRAANLPPSPSRRPIASCMWRRSPCWVPASAATWLHLSPPSALSARRIHVIEAGWHVLCRLGCLAPSYGRTRHRFIAASCLGSACRCHEATRLCVSKSWTFVVGGRRMVRPPVALRLCVPRATRTWPGPVDAVKTAPSGRWTCHRWSRSHLTGSRPT